MLILKPCFCLKCENVVKVLFFAVEGTEVVQRLNEAIAKGVGLRRVLNAIEQTQRRAGVDSRTKWT